LFSAALIATAVVGGPDKIGVMRRAQGVTEPQHCAGDCDQLERLDVTALIAQGFNPEQLQGSSLVSPQVGNFSSYAGYFNTNTTAGNNMFWWYFPPQNGNTSAPTVLWLQGGPGGSSLFGMMCEMGPFRNAATPDTIEANPGSWNAEYGILFIDNPVGAGFSYTTNDGYVTNEDEVAQNLYAALSQFYTVFPALQKNQFFITGESYGGHYVPAISAKLVEVEQGGGPNTVAKLSGIAVGDGWIDPVNMIPGYPEMMFNLGLASELQKVKIQEYCDLAVGQIRNGNYIGAFNTWDEMLNGDVYPYPNYFHNITGSNDYDNFLRTNSPEVFGWYAQYVSQASLRSAIHAGNGTFGGDASTCEHHLLADFHQTMRPRLEAVLAARVPVLIYSGQLDIIIGAALTERFLPGVEWAGKEALIAADRAVWKVNPSDEEVAGFAREVNVDGQKLTQVVVRSAGHIVPYDQPRAALDMITRFIIGKSFQE